MTSRHLFFLAVSGLVCFFLPPLGFGDETPDDKKPAVSVGDFSAGFRQLAALGIPDLKGARWVDGISPLGTGVEQGSGRASFFSYEFTVMLGKASEHGWLLKDNGRLYVLQIGRTQQISARSVQLTSSRQSIKLLKSHNSIKNSISEKDFSDAELEADVDSLIVSLEKEAEDFKRREKEYQKLLGDDDSPYSIHARQRRNNGMVLIFAAQIYQHGDAALANKLATALFKFFPEREKILASAVNAMAEEQYVKMTRTFFARGDWSDYEKELDAILKRFPRGWNDKGAVAILHDLVVKRNKSGVAKITAPDGQTLDPNAVAQLESMCAPGKTPKETGLSGSGYRMANQGETLWIIAPPKHDVGAVEIVALRKLGMKAIPALLAVINDDSLTRLLNNTNSFSYSARLGAKGDRDKEQFISLYRPLTRGEVAESLLREIIPNKSLKLYRANRDAIAEQASAFYEDYAGKTSLELAQLYMRDGDRDQQNRALNYFLRDETPEGREVFETYILQGPKPRMYLDSVKKYAVRRGDLAKDFCRKYVELVRKEDAELRGNISGDADTAAISNMEDYHEQELRELEYLAGLVAPESGEKPASSTEKASAAEISAEVPPKH
jgi:hypothetical protein